MKQILLILAAAAALCGAAPANAQSRDTELKVERRVLDREDKVNRQRKGGEELTRGIHITVKNIGLKPTTEGEVEWGILVERPGQQRALFSTGKEALKALKTSEVATFDVGAVPVQDIGNKRQDMEYQVIVRRDGKEVARLESTASFSQQANSARPVERKGGKQK